MILLRRFGVLLTLAVLAVLLMQTRTPAQSVANLQSDIFALRAQVSQLQSQVAQLSGRSGYPTPTPQPRSSRGVGPSDGQIIDRLANLAIDAKERLNALESRVAQLEKRATATPSP